MEETFIATWLNTVCSGFDYAIFNIMHEIAVFAGGIMTPLFSLISFIGEKGILVFMMALVLIFFRKTRKAGICVFVAVCIGALFTNIILKDLIARPRPFEELSIYYSWWQFVGSPEESGYSFPSGHVTAAMAGTLALAISLKKPAAWLAILYVAMMALSRVYLVVHYPTDVIAAIFIGALAAILAFLLVDYALKAIDIDFTDSRLAKDKCKNSCGKHQRS